MNRDSLEEKLELAPKYGQNQAWLLLNSVLDDEERGIWLDSSIYILNYVHSLIQCLIRKFSLLVGAEYSKQRTKPPKRDKYSPLKGVSLNG